MYLLIFIIIIILCIISKDNRFLINTLGRYKNKSILCNVVTNIHNVDCDIFTMRQIKQKMKRLDVYNFRDLCKEVKKRADPDNYIIAAKNAIKADCNSSKCMEILGALVLYGDDPLLRLPFYNETIIKEEIKERIKREHLPFQDKNIILQEIYKDYRHFPFICDYLSEF